jgi:hypothetical protein
MIAADKEDTEPRVPSGKADVVSAIISYFHYCV